MIRMLQIRPGEERTAALLVGLMLFTAAGSAVGGNATEALFFARFGTQQLPVMYIILGLFAFGASLGITALMGRVNKLRLFTVLPALLAIFLLGERLVIFANLRWFFALMWLSMHVINSLNALLTWGLAGATIDTRQAKRLFPLFSAGGIFGTVLGGLVTRPLAGWLRAENLLLVWAGAMLVTFGLARALTTGAAVQPVSQARQPSVIDEMQRGFRFVRRSKIMQWISISSVLFSVSFYALALPFSRGAAAVFSDADRLAGFLGQFQSLSTLAALLMSLFLANRAFARFGIMTMLLVFPLIYLVGFAVLAVVSPFAVLVGVRFLQTAYMNGMAGTAWQAMYNVVPHEQRDQVRAFVSGVPEQAGTLIAGLVLFAGDQALQPQQLYLVGLAAAALLAAVVWRASRSYARALVDALRAGQPQVFFSEERPFGGPRADGTAVMVVLDGLADPEPSVRLISAEIAGHMPGPETPIALVNALTDPDAQVRAAALKGLARLWASSELLEISASLSDPDPEVRCQAVEALGQLAGSPRGIVAHVEPLLRDDDPFVRAQAALTLLRADRHAGASETLHALACDPSPRVRARAIKALGRSGDASAFETAAAALDDDQPVVRRAACEAAARLRPTAAVEPLVRRLSEADASVQRALASALGKTGESALHPLVAALADPAREDGALAALAYLPAYKVGSEIRDYARISVETALRYHRLALGLAQKIARQASGDGRLQLIADSVAEQSRRCGLNALRALGLLTAREPVAVAVDNLRSRYPSQRANALETLEAVGEREIVRPLLVLWEPGEAGPVDLPGDWLADLLRDSHPWLRACAVLAAAHMRDERLDAQLDIMRLYDPDEFVRVTAAGAVFGDTPMETLSTLSLMERILFLRRVPIFADLPPADLKQVAAVASEVVFSDGQVLARQGDIGDEMYIVVSGEVQVLISAGNHQQPRELACRKAGDYVGEMAVISQEPRMATLVADGTVRVLCLKQKLFEGILRERPEVGLAMMRVLSQRLREASTQQI